MGLVGAIGSWSLWLSERGLSRSSHGLEPELRGYKSSTFPPNTADFTTKGNRTMASAGDAAQANQQKNEKEIPPNTEDDEPDEW